MSLAADEARSAHGRAARNSYAAALHGAARSLEYLPAFRRRAVALAQRRLRESCGRLDPPRNPRAVDDDKLALGLALVELADRALREHRLSASAQRGFLRVLVHDVVLERGDAPGKAAFRARNGCPPPGFLVLSPGQACNLSCTGCIAGATTAAKALDWTTLDQLVMDAHESWGVRFFVLSGGEPLAWRSERRGVLDLAARHPDCYFLMYTNGTLIDDAAAHRLAAIGNLSPAVSLEGLREPTDARRGDGAFERVLAAMARLRRAGVLFGASLTATRQNADTLLAEEAVAMLDRVGAAYTFLFHYMPIGRACDLGLTMTPAQRIRLWERSWQLVRERRMFLADFWSGGTLTNGCVAAGRPGGYLHVDWNGAVSPCVFVPFAAANVHDVYARGGTLDDVWKEPFFAAIRRWQRAYGYREKGQPAGEVGNWLMPCPIRDHHHEFRQLLAAHPAAPTSDEARAAGDDPAYHERLEAFDRELAALSDPIWRSRYAGTPSWRGREEQRAAR